MYSEFLTAWICRPRLRERKPWRCTSSAATRAVATGGGTEKDLLEISPRRARWITFVSRWTDSSWHEPSAAFWLDCYRWLSRLWCNPPLWMRVPLVFIVSLLSPCCWVMLCDYSRVFIGECWKLTSESSCPNGKPNMWIPDRCSVVSTNRLWCCCCWGMRFGPLFILFR
jgi:hypothetical protein